MLFSERQEAGFNKLPLLSLMDKEGIVPQEETNRKNNSSADKSKYLRVVPGDIAYNTMRMWEGRSAYVGIEGLISPAYTVCVPAVKISGIFFSYYFKTEALIEQFRRYSQGLVKDTLNLKYEAFSRIEITYPKEEREQQKIADCLASLDELITLEAQKLDTLKTHKKGLMQQLFPAEGETLPKLRFPEFLDAGEWERKTLKDIAEISSGSTPLRSNKEFFVDGSIPWVKTTDLNNSFIIETEEKITPKAKARINPVGSVLVAMYGGFNQIGRTGCLSVPAATNQAISVLVLDRQAALPVYVLAWLNAKVEDWKRIASSSRKDPNITGSDVGKFPITLPKPQEQQRIADCLASLDDLITAQTQKLAMLKNHKKGLMQQLFPALDEVQE
jgi:type I restriction enzyme S subunit